MIRTFSESNVVVLKLASLLSTQHDHSTEGNVIMQRIRKMLKQRSTLAFFLLTFGLSKAVWVPMMMLQCKSITQSTN